VPVRPLDRIPGIEIVEIVQVVEPELTPGGIVSIFSSLEFVGFIEEAQARWRIQARRPVSGLTS
jgi:hypothetical protein